jgi:phage gpG-like protein
MQFNVSVRDNISPMLAHVIHGLTDKRPILEGMGLKLVSLGKRAFNDASLRPSTWAAVKKTGPKNAPLKLSCALYKSLRVVSMTDKTVTVGSDRVYAAIHQLGGKTKAHIIRPKFKRALAWPGGAHPVKMVNHPGSNIPARPYFPFRPDGAPTQMASRKLVSIIRAKLQAFLPK